MIEFLLLNYYKIKFDIAHNIYDFATKYLKEKHDGWKKKEKKKKTDNTESSEILSLIESKWTEMNGD